MWVGESGGWMGDTGHVCVNLAGQVYGAAAARGRGMTCRGIWSDGLNPSLPMLLGGCDG